MNKLEKILELLSMAFGTGVFSFLIWLTLIYRNMNNTIAFIIGGVMLGAMLYFIFYRGYFILHD